MSTALLQMKHIVKTFPGVKALNNAEITVHAGEIMGFMGENGAGKSTLMNILGGVFPADSGEIYMDGHPVKIRSIHESQQLGISFIHQELALEPYLTIAEIYFSAGSLRTGSVWSAKIRWQRRRDRFWSVSVCTLIRMNMWCVSPSDNSRWSRSQNLFP